LEEEEKIRFEASQRKARVEVEGIGKGGRTTSRRKERNGKNEGLGVVGDFCFGLLAFGPGTSSDHHGEREEMLPGRGSERHLGVGALESRRLVENPRRSTKQSSWFQGSPQTHIRFAP